MLSAILTLSVAAIAPPSNTVTDVSAYADTVESIVREALANGRAYERLEELCRLAPRRLAGSPGNAAALEWARQVMLADGFENVRLEEVTVPHWERGEVAELRFAAPGQLAGDRLTVIALGGSVATPENGVTGEVVEVQSLEEAEELGERLRDKIVFFNRPMDPTLVSTFQAYGGAVDQRTRGASTAAQYGALAVIVRSMTTRLDDNPHTGATRFVQEGPNIPAAAISTVAADHLSSLLEDGENVRLNLRLDCRWYEPVPSFNVVGELVGSERPDEVVVVGGHIDAWDVGHGAHDDGAGCCHALEAVRLIKTLGLKPRRTIRAVMFNNEENGLAGGRAYRNTHADDMGKHVFAVESDAGGFTPRGFTSNAGEEAMVTLKAIGELLRGVGIQDVYPGGGGADISPMTGDGVVLAGFRPDSARYFDLHHSPADTFDKVNPRELHQGAAAIAALVYIVADLEEPLPRNPTRSE